MMKKTFFAGLMLAFFAFSGCSTFAAMECPYVIEKPHVVLGKVSGKHNFAGAYFNVFNDSQKRVDSLTFSFMVYDKDGQNPFVGSNNIVSRCDDFIEASSAKEFCVNLDSYLSVVPDEPYLIDFLYLREIHYSDGSSWSDPFGMYASREVFE
ncbi:hypothetical protein [Treponema zioleckii]|uniref:hypothetical protein n=1 Tax=Treponema zioleckii TaxID=331680 RepID=UPI00168AC749|nr:hypothetical protein [Treponema zioleckii]